LAILGHVFEQRPLAAASKHTVPMLTLGKQKNKALYHRKLVIEGKISQDDCSVLQTPSGQWAVPIHC